MGGDYGLSDVQKFKLFELTHREKPLTDNMLQELATLLYMQENPELPQGAKTYCKEWLTSSRFHIKRSIKSKYLTKGNECEDEAVKILSSVCLEPYEKNEVYLENEFLSGTADIVAPKRIRDTKCSWDLFTMPRYKDDKPNSDYEWQVQGYMELYDKPVANIDYILVNTPIQLIEKEALYYARDNGLTVDGDLIAKFVDRMTYDHMSLEDKVTSFEIKRDKELMEKVKERVQACQLYIDGLMEDIKEDF